MLKYTILGNFSFEKGGQIYLAPGDNMEYGFEASSCMHELFHANLGLKSNIGLLMHMIELELNIEKEDLQYKLDLIEIRENLYKSTRTVQEVYANSLELLWVEEYCGIEVRNQVYERKTIEYKQYSDISRKIWNNGKETIKDRKKKIKELCVSVFDMDIFAEQFWTWLYQPVCLEKVIIDRLNYVFSNQECIKDARKLNENEIVEFAKMKFRYLSDNLQKGFEYSKAHLNIDMTELLLETIKVFDYSQLGMTKGEKFDPSCGAICVIKVLHISNGKVGIGIIQNFMEDSLYEVVELDKCRVHEILEEKRYVIVPCNEFIFNKDKAECEEINDKIRIVLLDSVQEFKRCIKNIVECEEIYIGDINDECEKNFFTVIYFRKRNCDKVIYMFPTLSIIVDNIFKEFQIGKQIKHPGKGMGFYNIFSAFDNWVEILKVLKETISFVTKSRGNIIHNENPCSKLLNQAKIDIGNNVFKIRGDDFFYINSILPTLQTEAMPFWILMEFENGENNGNIRCENARVGDIQLGEDKIGIVYFDDRSSAKNYRKKMIKENPKLNNYQIVGMDELFWLEIKKILHLKKIGMIFVQENAIQGEYFDEEQFEYLRLTEIRKK